MIVNTFWIGRKMGPVHAACLRSFLRNGHDVVLHSYGVPEDAPKGLRIFDASKLMGENEIIAHRETGSLSIASDIYRYRMQREGLGLYVDCDVYCVKSFTDSPYIIARECDTYFNNAILKIPQDSTLLRNLLDASEDRYFVPPWLPKKKILKRKILKNVGFGKHISRQPWGVIGPKLLTYYVNELGLQEHALGADKYSPLHHSMSHMLFQRGLTVSDLITARTIGLHLYNANIKGREIVEDSPLYEILHT